MRIALLSTETSHHAYFAREIAKRHELLLAVLETNSAKAPFPTEADFEKVREESERSAWGLVKQKTIDFAPVMSCNSVNDESVAKHLIELDPEILIVFGTGKIGAELIRPFQGRILNLHGGDPEEYRGLDTHYWAIYHNDFDRLVTTLHHLNENLDDGRMLFRATLPLWKGMKLHELRRANTEICVKLFLSALAMKQELGELISLPQSRKGRYYSFMPACLKDICRKKFEAFTVGLP